MSALLARVDALAHGVGKLRRRLAATDGWSGGYLVDEIAGHVQVIDSMLRLTAGELVCRGVEVERALVLVDARVAELNALLNEPDRTRR